MGRFDSSRTRVAPIFDRLRCIDPTGRTWLPALLKLPSREPPVTVTIPTGDLEEACWWPEEKRLSAPVALLRWLIENATPPESTGAWGGAETRAKREALVSKDPARIAEALNLVATAPDERAWYVLEGRTCPDVFLTTNDTVVVIEGKRTEKGPTTITSWMSVRHQILRHIDSALEVASTRRVIGFFVVEGDGAVVPPHWRQAALDTISPDALAFSLPHRSDDERRTIANGFIGVTTRQALCGALNIPSEVLIDEVVD